MDQIQFYAGPRRAHINRSAVRLLRQSFASTPFSDSNATNTQSTTVLERDDGPDQSKETEDFVFGTF